MKSIHTRILSAVMAAVLVLGLLPMGAMAVSYDNTTDDYYKLISKTDYELAPGITESEIVLNNDAGTHRQVAHVVEVDIDNPYTKVIPSYKGMIPQPGNYGVQIMSQQAAYAEANGYGNVVAAMNLSLSWYTGDYYNQNPHLIGEPLGYMILDGVQYTNSKGQTAGAQTCLVINFDEKDGVARPADVPKTEIRATSSPITGWEEQVIPANFGFLVKDGVNQYTKNHTSDPASRSFVGIKANGDIVIVMNDGRQPPYSAGFNSYEMADFMISLGCVQAVNGDGGGSSAFLSQRPGEELELHCSPSDGGERATTHGVLVISTAPSNGEFVRAQVSADGRYFTPNSTVQFTAVGADLAGAAAEIPEEAYWQLSDPTVGTIDENGLFVSNGTTGTVSAQLVYNDKVVGSYEINIVIPDSIQFSQSTLTVPNGKSSTFSVSAKYGVFEVVTTDADFKVELGSADMGVLNGYELTATEDSSVTGGTIIATLTHDSSVTETMNVVFGKASEVFYDFENGFGPEWSVEFVQYRKWFVKKMKDLGYGNFNNIVRHYPVTAENGMVHDGNGAAALYSDNSLATLNWTGATMRWMGETVTFDNVKSIGAWVYIPEDAVSYAVRFCLIGVKNGETTGIDAYPITFGDSLYMDESGWKFCSVDVSSYDSIILNQGTPLDEMTASNYNNGFRLEVTSQLNGGSSGEYSWQTTEGVKGINTFYIDNLVIDYSEACDDKDAPIFGEMSYMSSEMENAQPLNNLRKDATVVNSNSVSFTAPVAENTASVNATGLNVASAKAYIDGNEVTVKLLGNALTTDLIDLTNGVHTVKFTILDNAGNYASVIRKINVQGNGDDATVKVLPRVDADQVLTSSQVWIDIVAQEAEKVEKITVTLDLNSANEWLLDHIETLYGFTATYEETPSEEGTATLTITRTGDVEATGEQVIASVPAQTWQWIEENYPGYYPPSAGDSDLNKNGMYDPYEYWTEYVTHNFDVIVNPLAGTAEFIDGTSEWFSGDYIKADTEQVVGTWWGSGLNATQKAELFGGKTSYHLHKAGEAVDKDATCLENGYTGRVFCTGCSCVTEEKMGHVCDAANGCGAVLDWGTVISAPGHIYVVTDGVLACEGCGKLFNGEKDGKTYIDGVIADGWIDNTYYYIDGVMVTGQYYMDGTMYTFGTDGVYQPNFMFTDFYETTDGKLMYFVSNKPLTGYQSLMGKAYFFDDNGYGYEGEYTMAGETCLFENGQFVSSSTANVINAGLAGNNATYVIYADGVFKLDGSGSTFSFTNHGTRPFIDYIGKIKTIQIGKDITRIATNFFAWTHVTKVEFSKVGKLEQLGTSAFLGCVYLREIELPGTLTYMSTNSFGRCTNLTKVIVPDSVTNISTKSFKDCGAYLTLYVTKDSYALEYAIANSINYKIFEAEIVKEIVEVDGVLYYVVDGVKTYGGLICLDGDYYYIRSNCQAVVNRSYWVTKTNDLLPEGNYTFGADGKMLNPPVVEPEKPDVPVEPDVPVDPEEPEVPSIPEAPGQIVDVNGVLYYRENGVNKYAGLIYLNGAIYYVRSNGQLAVSRTYWTTKHNDLLKAANYEFDAEGKMINPPIELPEPKPEEPDVPVEPEEPEVPSIPEAPGQIVNLNGVLYYRENGVNKYAGLIYKDGAYYYVRSNGQLAVNRTYWTTKTNDLLPAANYVFGADGKMIIN